MPKWASNAERQRDWRNRNPDKYKASYSSPEAKAKRKVWYQANREKAIQYTVDWQRRNPEYVARKARGWKYGLTEERYQELLHLQAGVCAVCHKAETRRNRAGKVHGLCVDHDHLTGLVRGLVCHRCNAALGYADDSPELLMELAAYLLRNRGGASGN